MGSGDETPLAFLPKEKKRRKIGRQGKTKIVREIGSASFPATPSLSNRNPPPREEGTEITVTKRGVAKRCPRVVGPALRPRREREEEQLSLLRQRRKRQEEKKMSAFFSLDNLSKKKSNPHSLGNEKKRRTFRCSLLYQSLSLSRSL